MNGQDEIRSFTAYVDPSIILPLSLHVASAKKSMSTSSLPGSSDLDYVLKSGDAKKLKRFVRVHHWPADHEVRRTLWWSLCSAVHGKQAVQTEGYTDILKDVLGEDAQNDDVVPLPSFVDAAHLPGYRLSAAGVVVARRVLCVVAHQRPDVVYSPALFALVALLLHYLSEEDCYRCVSAMIRSRERYFAQTRAAYEAWPLVLQDLVRKYAKPSHQLMLKNDIAPDMVLENWIWWILQYLPFAYLVRIMDVFLYEGLKFFYRIGLAILIHFEKLSGQYNFKTNADFVRNLQLFCTDMPIPINKLFKTAFGVRGLSRSEIWRLTVKKEIYVQSRHNVAMLQSTLPLSPSAGSLTRVNVHGAAGSQIVGNSETDGAGVRPRSNSQDADYYPSFSKTRSAVMAGEQWRELYGWLPRRFTLQQPTLLFSTAEHGTSLNTFYNRVDGHEPTFIVIKTKKGEVIGAYCSVDWAERKTQQRTLKYFGTGESFVCRLLPAPHAKFPWVGIALGERTPNTAHLFMCGDTTQINLGGGNGIALMLDENLLRGSSERCDTYDNPPLVDGGFFDVVILEVFAFD